MPKVKPKPVSYDARHFKIDPYDHIPPMLSDQQRRIGIHAAPNEEKTVQVNTRVPGSTIVQMDLLIEKRSLRISSRADFVRLAVQDKVYKLVGHAKNNRIKLSVYRLEAQRRQVAAVVQLNDINEMAAATLKAARGYYASGEIDGVLDVLRRAKRYSEDIVYKNTRERFVNKLYGSKDGSERPVDWKDDPVAVKWDEVWNGALDEDTEEADEAAAGFGSSGDLEGDAA